MIMFQWHVNDFIVSWQGICSASFVIESAPPAQFVLQSSVEHEFHIIQYKYIPSILRLHEFRFHCN